MQILHGILHGILADNILTDEEIIKLSDWINEHDYLNGIYPYDEIKSLLKSVLSDGVIDEDEREMLKAFFSEFIDTTLSYNLNQNELNALKTKYNVNGICSACPEIIFTGASFCFTGASTRATRSEIKDLIEQTGATFSDSVTKKTDYLVVGDDGNPAWVFACYGRKVEKAISMVCMQPNKRLALGCQYRKHLTNGRIFYGANQNTEFR
ncbi:BRCT domain-containing protein [Desulfosporosinus fructosivorans]